jgi:hypothetical protein
MGWEWRCFLPLPSAVEVREVTVDERGEPAPMESRTDHYLLVASAAVGIKLRGGSGLEVKKLKDEKQRGALKWKKNVVGEQADPEAGALAEADAFFASAAVESQGGGQAAADPALASAHHTSGCHWVSVQKQRQQAWLSWAVGGVCVEQATLSLQLHESQAAGGAAVGEPLHYRTIAVEGAPPPQLYAAVERWLGLPEGGDKAKWLDTVHGKLGPGSVVGGYPELLRTAFAHVLQPVPAAGGGDVGAAPPPLAAAPAAASPSAAAPTSTLAE